MRFAIYLRASTDTQGDSYDTQRLMLQEYCQRTGDNITVERRDEATSGSIPVLRRPGAADLLGMVAQKRRPFDAILVVRKDRLFRDLADELDTMRYLQLHRCPLYTPAGEVDRSTPEGELMSNLLGSIAQFERKLTGQRIREHNLARAMQGKHPAGYLPLGLRWDPKEKRIEVTDRAFDVARLMQCYLDCHGNLMDAARRANQQGLRSAAGRPFSDVSLRNIIANPLYRQRIEYAGKVFDAPDVPRIVPTDLTAQIDALLPQVGTMPARAKGADNCYSGRLRCAICGDAYHMAHASTDVHPDGRRRHTQWGCKNRRLGMCDSCMCSERYLDRLVGRALEALFATLGAPDRLPDAPPVPRPSRRDTLTRQRARWAELYAEGVIDWPTMQAHVAALDADLAALDTQAPVPPPLTPELLATIAASLGDTWAELSHATRRTVLTALGARLYFTSQYNTPRRIELQTTLSDPVIVMLPTRIRKSV